MATSPRYTRSDIRRGAVKLVKNTEFLLTAVYLALTHRTVNGERIWYAEVPVQDFRKMFLSTEKASKLRVNLRNIKTENRKLEDENADLRAKNKALEAANARLMKNIQEDARPDRYTRSPKNYHNVIEERSFKPQNPLPLQGGLAGVEKK